MRVGNLSGVVLFGIFDWDESAMMVLAAAYSSSVLHPSVCSAFPRINAA